MATAITPLIFVIGMHRSGTSALCAALDNLGLNFGVGLLAAMEGVNDEGFWEDGEIVELNERLLSKVGFHWYSLFEPSPAVDWQSPRFDEERAIAEEILKRGFGGFPEAVKDPRFCLTLPFWLNLCSSMQREARVLCISRPPIEVAQSLEKRDHFPISFGLRLVERYQRALEAALPDSVVRVTYEDLLLNPIAALEGVPKDWFGNSAASPEITSVRADFRHHVRSEEDEILGRPLCSASDLEQLREKLDSDYPLSRALEELTRAFTERGAELSEIGAAHTEALATLDQRDADVDALAAELRQALATIAERDQQIVELDQRLSQAGTELESTMDTVSERDEQITEFDRRLSKLGEEHSHALTVITERDAQIAEREAQLDRIRNIPGVGLIARRLLSNEKS